MPNNRPQPVLPRTTWYLGLLATTALLVSGHTQAQPATAPAPPKAAEKAKKTSKIENWVRVRTNKEDKPEALEVAIVRYIAPKYIGKSPATVPQYVDLVGAIHVGDLSYYEALNRRFRTYDALLYELVAPEGTVVERGRGTSSSHPLGALQNGMKSMLALEHQLEKVDYTRPNFIHADLSPSEFLQSMNDKNESFLQMYCRLMGQSIAMQSQHTAKGNSADADILVAMFSKDRPRMLKTAFAKQFDMMESMLNGISGPEGSTLITERNKRALEVLREQQAAGKQKIGIFYGAGHLSDMHERMVKEFGLQPIQIEWLEAWNLRPKQ